MGLLTPLKGVWYSELRYYSDVSNCKDSNPYHFSCFFLNLLLVKELRKNHADLVYVNSTDHSIVMAISNLNSTPALHLNDVNQETVENLVAPESYSPCQETPPKVEDSPTVACSAVAFGNNIFDEFGITLMVSRILTHLQWTSTFAFFENSTGVFIS